MAIITLTSIKKSFGARDLFVDASFFINDRERAALIGANGTGKSTLLKMICGEVQADSGTISRDQNLTIGYLPQEVDLPGEVELFYAVTGVTPELMGCALEMANLEAKLHTASESDAGEVGAALADASHRFESLHGFEYQAKGKSILSGLGFDESDFYKPVHLLSGGQKIRAAMSRLLLLSPDILLLDEPTNHLDIQACEWLQEYLREKFTGAALIVSHDRYFLDRVVDKVVEIDNGGISTYKGNYSEFARLKAVRIEEQRKIFKEQQKEIAKLESAIQTLFSHRKFSRRDSKVKQLERIERTGRLLDNNKITVGLSESIRSGREVLRLAKLSKAYPGKTLFSEADFLAERGRKIGIVGPNGSGKTTLLKIVASRLDADSGEVIFGYNVKPVYFAQEFDHLDPNSTVIEELLSEADISSKEARDILARFLFLGDDAFKNVGVLSGGETCRLALAKVLADKPNLLLLDEPTNHLDIASREAVEDALRSYTGTVLAASHDRYLLDAICDEIIEIKDGCFTRHIGTYSDYKAKTAEPEPAAVAVSPRKNTPPPASNRKLSPLQDATRRLRELNKQQKEIEQSIMIAENRVNELTAAMGDEENYRTGAVRELSSEYDKVSDRLKNLYTDWEDLCDRITSLESEVAELSPN